MRLPLAPKLRLALLWPAAAALIAVALLLAVVLPSRLDRSGALGVAVLMTGAALAAVAWWLNRRFFRPLSALILDANRMARGGGGRLPIPEAEDLATFAQAVNRLASRVEEQVAAVELQRDHLEEILASMPDGVLVTGRDGRASVANPAFRRLFGLHPQGIEGRSPAELARQPLLAQLVEQTLSSGETRRGDIELVGPERRSLALQSSALGARAGVIVVVRDVTSIERLSEVRRDFVANVSHELKTPLAAIRAYAETLRDGALADPDAAPRFIERILAQCRRLQALLDDLLTLSRLEAIGEQVERQPVDLGAVVRRALEVIASATREKGVEVAVTMEPVPPVMGDADALERLVVNLLDNAIKYNRPGGRVDLRLLRPADRADQVEVLVADTGIGIPAESLPRIFERFYRVDKARSRDEGGTGLGLAIVKHVAQAHAGRVDVESEIGHGSTFRVRLPLSEARSDGTP